MARLPLLAATALSLAHAAERAAAQDLDLLGPGGSSATQSPFVVPPPPDPAALLEREDDAGAAAATTRPAATGAVSGPALFISIGSYAAEADAAAAADAAPTASIRVVPFADGGATVYRVLIGPYDDPDTAGQDLTTLRSIGYENAGLVTADAATAGGASTPLRPPATATGAGDTALPDAGPPPPSAPAATAAEPTVTVRQFVFVGDTAVPDTLPPRTTEGGAAVEIVGVELLQDPDFIARVTPYLDRPLTFEDLNEMMAEAIAFLRERQRPVVDVFLTRDSLQQDRIVVLVLEGLVGRIVVEGNEHFSDRLIASAIRANAGDPIEADRLSEDLRWVNDNPFRSVDLIYRPGQIPGATDLVLAVNDSFPLRVYGSYTNAGNDLIGENLWSAGINYGNAFELDHRLLYQFTTADDPEDFHSHFLSYSIPLPWYQMLRLATSISRTDVQIDEFFSQTGTNIILEGSYRIPIRRPDVIDGFQHSALIGLTYKRIESDVEFGGVSVGTQAPEQLLMELLYEATWQTEIGVIAGNLGLSISPGDLTSDNTDAVFNASRFNASARYATIYGGVTGDILLPYDFVWRSSISGQVSSTNLLSSQQLPLTGASGVRGFPESQYAADSGVVIRNELYTPSIQVLPRLESVFEDADLPNDSLQFLAFLDYAYGDQHTALDIDPHPVSIASAGLGVRYSIFPWLSLRADYAWELGDFAGNGRDEQLHLGVVIGN
ncbi:MAG: ShlB/FhaC/HecB family hemolysin secretion/activation protein [Azospirillaceae bacterium]